MTPRLDFSDDAVGRFYDFPISAQPGVEARLDLLSELEAIRSLGLSASEALKLRNHEFTLKLGVDTWLEVFVATSFDIENRFMLVVALGHRIVDKSG